MNKKSTNKFYVAIDKDDDKRRYIFEAKSLTKTGRPRGSINGEISVEVYYEFDKEVDTSSFNDTAEWEETFCWKKSDWDVRSATADEINWLLACRTAGEYVEKPKITEMFLIY